MSLYIIGFGPGSREGITEEAMAALEQCEIIVGYHVYTELLCRYFAEKEFYSTPMKQERERCLWALQKARSGRQVGIVCSGDSGIYGMAGLVLQLAQDAPELKIKVIPGVTAASSGAAVLGAPLGHDFAVISLSDLLTPLEQIEKRLRFAAMSDMVICLYNPSSKKRSSYLGRACDVVLEYQSGDTVCGYVRNIGREGEEAFVLPLRDLRDTQVDMFTTVYIGNSKTRNIHGRMVTPRGYRDV